MVLKLQAVNAIRQSVVLVQAGLNTNVIKLFEFDKLSAPSNLVTECRAPSFGGGYGETFWYDFFGLGRQGQLGGELEIHLPFDVSQDTIMYYLIHEGFHKWGKALDNEKTVKTVTVPAYVCCKAKDICDRTALMVNPIDADPVIAKIILESTQSKNIYDFLLAIPPDNGAMNADSLTCVITFGKGC